MPSCNMGYRGSLDGGRLREFQFGEGFEQAGREIQGNPSGYVDVILWFIDRIQPGKNVGL